MRGLLTQVNVSNGGMPKHPVVRAIITRDGVGDDWQKNRKYHGGPDRAVCLFSEELYDWLRGQGVKDLVNGSIGENFTTRGIDLMSLSQGDRLAVGRECIIELTDVREPCRQLKKWDPRFPKLILGRSGWLARVVVEGEVKAGDAIEVLEGGAVSESFELVHDDQGRLVLRRLGREDVVDVRVRRAFPWSARDAFISIRDAEGKELLLVDSLEPLDDGRRSAIERALADASFVPRITAVEDVDVRFGYQQWKVRTDRGPAEFRVQEREDIRFLPDGRFRIKDADGTVYEMVSLADLDEASRRAVEPLI